MVSARRGDGWREEGKERFCELLKLLKENRKREGSVEMDNRLLQYCQKTSKKKTARKRKRVTEPRKPAKRYDAMDSDNDTIEAFDTGVIVWTPGEIYVMHRLIM